MVSDDEKMNRTNKTSEVRDENLLQAFRYVASELTADESDSFELAMLEDPSLCDAVVQVTSLTTAISATASQPAKLARPTVVVNQIASERPARATTTAIATGIAVCCCLALLVVVSQPASNVNIASVTGSVEQEDAEMLVGVWTDEAISGAAVELEESDIVPDDLDVPDWLLAAVTISDLDGMGTELPDDIEL